MLHRRNFAMVESHTVVHVSICMVTHSTKQAYLFQFPVQSMKTTAFSMYDLKIIIISVVQSQNRLVSISYFDIYTKLEITIFESLYKPKHVDVNINNKFCMK